MDATDRPDRRDPAAHRLPQAVEVLAPGRRPRQARLGRPPGRIAQLFGFLQFELPATAGLSDARYVTRDADEAVERIVVIRTLGSSRPARRWRRRRRREPEATGATRVTVIDAAPLGEERAAKEWLERACRGARGSALAAEAVATLLRALDEHGSLTAEPASEKVEALEPSRCRAGYGDGKTVAEGRFAEARELEPPPAQR